MLDVERRWLIVASLGVTIATFAFFLLAPEMGYPIYDPDHYSIIRLIVPVFMGYLGLATQFVFGDREPSHVRVSKERMKLIRLMVRGPIYSFVFVMILVVIAFGLSNRPGSASGDGMKPTELASIVTALLALLAGTTNAAAAYLFKTEKGADNAGPAQVHNP